MSCLCCIHWTREITVLPSSLVSWWGSRKARLMYYTIEGELSGATEKKTFGAKAPDAQARRRHWSESFLIFNKLWMFHIHVTGRSSANWWYEPFLAKKNTRLTLSLWISPERKNANAVSTELTHKTLITYRKCKSNPSTSIVRLHRFDRYLYHHSMIRSDKMRNKNRHHNTWH